MKSAAQTGSRKPSVAFTLEEKALENLECKIARLQQLIEEGSFASAPRSLRTFNSWTAKLEPHGVSFESNASETLRRQPELQNRVAHLLRTVRESRAEPQRARDVSVQRARQSSETNKVLRQIAEAAVVSTRTENVLLRRKVEALTAQVEAVVAESARIREKLETENNVLRQQHAEMLRNSPKNVKMIHDRRDK